MPTTFTSFADARFWECYHGLPKDIQRLADKAFDLFDRNPQHPSLHFKKIGRKQPIYSARVTKNYRVLGYLVDEHIYWFWIGDHKAYDRLIGAI